MFLFEWCGVGMDELMSDIGLINVYKNEILLDIYFYFSCIDGMFTSNLDLCLSRGGSVVWIAWICSQNIFCAKLSIWFDLCQMYMHHLCGVPIIHCIITKSFGVELIVMLICRQVGEGLSHCYKCETKWIGLSKNL